MRTLLAFLLAMTASACAPDGEPSAPPTRAVALRTAAPTEAAPVAVVELFTSEGCSSCPPADALLRELADDPGVIALSFHVDYWDYLGWRDPYSSADHTARQRAYTRTLGMARPYTPQLVVGGTTAFVGSRRAEAQEKIARALGRPAALLVDVTARHADGTVEVAYVAEDAPEGAVVHLALVQKETATDVPRGENRGQTLRHAHVVRVFETVAAGRGSASLALPDGLEPSDALVVAYAQQGATGAVLGAAQVAVE